MASRITFLDALRVFAFASVLIGHKFYPALAAASTSPDIHMTLRTLAKAVMPLTAAGGAGVVVFFLVSGYIITHVILRETVAEFLIKRLFRIYPLYVSAVLAQVAVGAISLGTPVPPWHVLLPRLTLTGDVFGTPYALGGVEWTLRIEIVFYVIMALLARAGLARRPRWLPLAFFAVVLGIQGIGPTSTDPDLLRGYVTLFLPFLFVGACVYVYEHRLARRSATVACGTYALMSYFVLLPGINRSLIDSNFAIYATGLFVLAWRFGDHIPSSWGLTFLSELTYSVYLFHNWIWATLTDVVLAVTPGIRSPQAATLAALFLFCAITSRLIEKPFIRLGKTLAGRPTRGRPVGTPEPAGGTH